MKNDFKKRKTLRLQNYDYSENGAYFITICTKDKKQILSKITGETVATTCLQLTQIGKTAEDAIKNIHNYYPSVFVDYYCIMPNHIHIIIIIEKDKSTQNHPAISTIINQFKGFVTKKTGLSIWQPSYYDHVIRNERELSEIRKYIIENPLKTNLKTIINHYQEGFI